LDAARLLADADSKLIETLDRLAGGLLLAAPVAGAGFTVGLFGAKSELVRLGRELLTSLGQRLQGTSRFARSERLAGAHAIIVVTSYFEAFESVGLPFDSGDLALTGARKVGLAAGGDPDSNRLGELASALLHAEVPAPAPQFPYERTLESLAGFYEHLSEEVYTFVTGLAVWVRLDTTARRQVRDGLRHEVPGRALARYEDSFRRLAAEFPEVGFWANAVDHQATRAEVRALSVGLAGIEEALATIVGGRVPDERRLGLARAYQAQLDRPVLISGDVPEGLSIPRVGEAYVNPDFRAAQDVVAERLSEESWWDEHPVRSDLQVFLVGHLTSPQATVAPLLVLGQPGSGKSLFTQVLAARLPASEFLVVRVVLRDAPADADLQTQIEHAVRVSTGEHLTWPELARSAAGALPVVLLDGFDELLQTTGVSQSDFLEKAADFQLREAAQDRPVAVLVTSRTAVADRARSAWNMVVVRIEPFRDSQIAQWLDVWNAANAASLAAKGLRPLPLDPVLAHADLGRHPLLLLMLALYDADGNPLQAEGGRLGHAELYERLLTRFAEREVRKTGATLTAAQFEHAVDREMLYLSVVAFAMFNRRRQWVTEAELDADLSALLGDQEDRVQPVGLRAALTAAQIVIGRFFFVHEARATRDENRLKTYEFLHATFGEYLVGRLVARELADLADTVVLTATRTRRAAIDDAFLHALLSFMPLTTRASAVEFLKERLAALPETRRGRLRDILLTLFHRSLHPRHTRAYDDYEPTRVAVPARHAAYSANLALLAILAGRQVADTDLFPGQEDPIREWRRITYLWRSQLPTEGWNSLVHTLAVHRGWEGDRRVLHIGLDPVEAPLPPADLYWSYDIPPSVDARQNLAQWRHYSHEDLRQHNHFMCDKPDDTLMHALEPLARDLDPAVGEFYSISPDRAVSSANSLITLWLTGAEDTSQEELVNAYDTCLSIILRGLAAAGTPVAAAHRRFCSLVLRQMAADRERLPPDWLNATRVTLAKAQRHHPDLLAPANMLLPESAGGEATTPHTRHTSPDQ
jgi:hypothetical protein